MAAPDRRLLVVGRQPHGAEPGSRAGGIVRGPADPGSGRCSAATSPPTPCRSTPSARGYRLTGYAGLPTLHRRTSAHQYLFVNGRPVRDKLLLGAVRGAYMDFIASDRHPMLALFLELPAEEVDVNVHPAKTEVRFRDAGLVRGLIVGALKHALARPATAPPPRSAPRPSGRSGRTGWRRIPVSPARPGGRRSGRRCRRAASRNRRAAWQAPVPAAGGTLDLGAAPAARYENAPADPVAERHPLGAARAQIHATYIVAQTEDGLVIVDQHAAHERLVYERMKEALAAGGVARQALLLPEVVGTRGGGGRPAGGARPGAGRARPGARGLRAGRGGGARGAGAARPDPTRSPWCATSPTTSPRSVMPSPCRTGWPTSAAPWPATARSGPAGGSGPRR